MQKPWLIWIPRGLAILSALLVELFSFDAFEGPAPLGTKLLGFLIHSIPFIVLALIIIFTWKRPLIAGVIFIAAAVFYFLWFMVPGQHWEWWPLPVPFLVTGVLYLLAHFLCRKEAKA